MLKIKVFVKEVWHCMECPNHRLLLDCSLRCDASVRGILFSELPIPKWCKLDDKMCACNMIKKKFE